MNAYQTVLKLYPVAKALVKKAGARHSFRDVSLLQQIHDMVCELGASCFLNEEDDSNLVEQSERDYKKEYREYHSKPKQKKNRAKRNAARRMMIKEGRARKGDGKEVDHKDGNPNNNSSSNLRVVSKKTNREKG